MLHLIWAIITVALWGFFLYLLYKAIMVLKQEMGWSAIIVLSMGLFCCNNSKSELEENKWKQKNTSIKLVKGREFTAETQIHKTILATYNLNLTYGIDSVTQNKVPLKASVGLNGAIIGTNTTIKSIDIYPTENIQQYHYRVYVVTKWLLLFAPVVTEMKNFEGDIYLN
jgi:hypothetical protein